MVYIYQDARYLGGYLGTYEPGHVFEWVLDLAASRILVLEPTVKAITTAVDLVGSTRSRQGFGSYSSPQLAASADLARTHMYYM